jgi:hypothetical protein
VALFAERPVDYDFTFQCFCHKSRRKIVQSMRAFLLIFPVMSS